jgi:hypothetical protein
MRRRKNDQRRRNPRQLMELPHAADVPPTGIFPACRPGFGATGPRGAAAATALHRTSSSAVECWGLKSSDLEPIAVTPSQQSCSIAEQVLRLHRFQRVSSPMIQGNGQEAIVVTTSAQDSVGLIRMSPKHPRESLRYIVWRRAARDVSGVPDVGEPFPVQFHQANVPKNPERCESALRELGTR